MLNLSRSRIKINTLLNRRFFSSKGTDSDQYSDRGLSTFSIIASIIYSSFFSNNKISHHINIYNIGTQAKGAMTEYFKQTAAKSTDSIWQK